MITHRDCECGCPAERLPGILGTSERYPGRYYAYKYCPDCGRVGAAGYSRYEQVAIIRAWKWWDAGKVGFSNAD